MIDFRQLDKRLHLEAGFIISFFSAYLFESILIGIISGITAGIAKEIYDEWKYGGADAYDFIATACGAMLGLLPYIVILK